MTKGWKCVQIDGDGNIFSGIVDYDTAKTTYLVGKTAFPNKDNGPLAVFDDYRAALSFAVDFSLAVYECEYEPAEGHKMWYTKEDGQVFDTAWYRTPKGTVFANSVKLLERINVEAEHDRICSP